MQPTHTPFDGSTKPFTIGLKPLDLAEWIEVDETYDFQMREKRRIYAENFDKVFVAEENTEAAQAEVLALIDEHMREHFPALEGSHRSSDRAELGHLLPQGEKEEPAQPLVTASLLVQEDMILMRQGPDGWRLAAGSLCFPSSWSLTEKFGKPMHEIHEPVPQFGPGTRMAELIARMFDRLQPGSPVQRFNWSIQSGDALYHPMSHEGRIERAAGRVSKFPGADAAAYAFIRVERQTLRKLPQSGDILFTIRIYLDPMAVLARHPDRATLAASFAEQLQALDTSQLDYKGLASDRDRLVGLLQGIAAS